MNNSGQAIMGTNNTEEGPGGLSTARLRMVIREEIAEDVSRRKLAENDKVLAIERHLKEKIICNDLPPESVVNLSEQAKLHGVSRTPVKEALIFLEAEGWLLRHGSHFQVTPLTLSRIGEISELRYILEPQAYIRAMRRLTKQELGVLLEIKERIETFDEQPDSVVALSLDIKFHRTLFRAAKNQLLAEQLDRLLFHYLRFWLSTQRDIDMDYYFRETVEIIQAVQDKDEERVIRASAKHIDLSLEAELKNIMMSIK